MEKNNFSGLDWSLVQSPGLTSGAKEIRGLAEDISRRLAVFYYKEQMPCFWVVFVGGTGTGKSTIFNAFCGKTLSETGVERPKTFGPILYAHQGAFIETDFPLPSIQVERHTAGAFHSGPATGTAGRLLVLEHDEDELSHLAVVDTPDLDSVERENSEIAEDLSLLADAVVFVTSQEKYADEVPYRFFLRITGATKPYFFLLNKADDQLVEEEVIDTLKGQGIALQRNRVWTIPYAPSQPGQWISEYSAFRDFVRVLSEEFSITRLEGLRKEFALRRASGLKTDLGRLQDILAEENRAVREWRNKLDALFQETSEGLIREQKEGFRADNREYIQREIRKLFTKYDVLAKPRRFIRELFATAFGLLGFRKEDSHENHKDALLKVRQKTDLTPVQRAIQRLNRLVLERLSPADETSPLFLRLREAGRAVKDEEIKERVWKEHDLLDEWLEQTFQKLAQELPRHKKWGIYSTSALWGVLILSFEVVAGGGFTVLDAVIDSVLGPFVTKGTVELFAYHEIRKIARELARRYQSGLVSVVREQRDRYEQALSSLVTPRETLESLQALRSNIGNPGL